ncbi:MULTISPECIES: MFS transporter [Thermococcus]|uniref:MFS transporter n=1 Tax=Thermococcus TaxID=2263 RepID=UPI001CED704A|nr:MULTISPECIES: MFS transporter [Thermococcus]
MRRDFAQAFASFAGILDTSFMMPIIALYAISLGASLPQAGIIAALYSIAAIPASIIAGLLVDRVGRKRTLTLGLMWDAFVVFLYGYVSSYHQLAILRVLHAFGGSLVFPALFAMARESDGEGKNNIVKVLSSMALAIAIGSATAGVLTARLGYKASFAILAFIIGLSALISTTLPETLGERSSEKGVNSWRLLGEFKYNVFTGLWLIFFLYVALGIMVGGLASSLVKGELVDERSARMITGIGFGFSSIVASVFFFIHGKMTLKAGPQKVAAYSSIISFSAFLLGIVVRTPGLLLGTLGAFGIALSGLMLASTLLVTEVPKEVRGTSVGLQQVFNIVGVSIGSPIGGFIALVGTKLVLLSAGFAVFIGGVGVFLMDKLLRRFGDENVT